MYIFVHMSLPWRPHTLPASPIRSSRPRARAPPKASCTLRIPYAVSITKHDNDIYLVILHKKTVIGLNKKRIPHAVCCT